MRHALAAGEATATDLVDEALHRQAVVDGWLRAFTQVTADDARAEAASLDARIDAREPVGPLSGVPIAVKGRAGLQSLQTRRLRAAGAVPIGTTSTPRGPGPQTWGHTSRGPTRNPWRPELSPGGSSAGSAAAVAAEVVPLATGSDGAGSARIPAAWCGIFGYKPTTGLLPSSDRTGLAVAAPLARHPNDLATWADVVLGELPPAPPPRTAVWSADLGFAAAQLDDEVVAVARAAAEQLASQVGMRWLDACLVLHDPAPAWTALRDPDATSTDRIAAGSLRLGNDRRLGALFAAADLLLTPTTPGPPHGHDGPGDHMSVALTWAFNLSGHPAISIPAGFTRQGAPVGLQIVARHRADRVLLTLAGTRPPAALPPAPTRPRELVAP
jgi:Asp-tRNA(Asn)/Glu-tRNA(Gln) amidotransferase A subunit family amidase